MIRAYGAEDYQRKTEEIGNKLASLPIRLARISPEVVRTACFIFDIFAGMRDWYILHACQIKFGRKPPFLQVIFFYL